ncbi:cyanophycinase [Pedobacter sp. SYP-B3415]|uniref:cyanophycinase n=1 Tax=Pedobacter sp. SYP-B3415 TaxID=2496641 RepID=UPI001F0F1DCB|nr:cyanophycinase [Pedobacter sp. SYP-B3415]
MGKLKSKFTNSVMRKLIVFACLFISAVSSVAQTGSKKGGAGKLFIIGGGERSQALMARMVAAAALGPADYMIVLPMASEQPDTGFKYLRAQIAGQMRQPVRMFDFNKHDVNDRKWVDSLAGARLIYILGGDQNRFMKSVAGTPVSDAIHRAFANGALIAGTSAGAAVMSRYMITGQQLLKKDYKETFDRLYRDNVEFADGLGLLNHTIIDQHFIRRSRYNRLLSALAEHPGYTAVGIDEGTAILVQGNRAEVVGDSQVIRLASPSKLQKTASGQFKFSEVDFGLYTAGDVFKLKP